jgi:5,5'-dehydrodivanillate O-demethylase oxygenase subunit
MLKPEENELLTRTGPGTPCGNLMRRYWQPVCYASELEESRTLAVKILGEELVVYRDDEYNYGLLGEHCSHRGTSLAYGYVEENCTLRCPYHGWKYNSHGSVVEQPFEPVGSNFKDKIKHPAYPVQELGGIIFGYLGPEPAPLLPRWDVLVRTDGEAKLTRSPILDCNWLQAQENSVDTVHTYFLHEHSLKLQGIERPGYRLYDRLIVAYGFKEFEWGLLKSFVTESDGVRASEIGNPLIFPNMVRVRISSGTETMHWRVPVDDESTLIFFASFTPSKDGSESPRVKYPPLHDNRKFTADGKYVLDYFHPQDWMAWETQGKIFDRSREKLGASDRGIALYRKMLRTNIQAVHAGEEPMALVRDPEHNRCIEFVTLADHPVEDTSEFTQITVESQP